MERVGGWTEFSDFGHLSFWGWNLKLWFKPAKSGFHPSETPCL